MPQAQDSVIPESTPASGASTYLRASWVVNIAEDHTEYENLLCNKKLPAEKTYATAKEAVEKGVGNWGRTNITLLNPCLK
jgi:hypothetical protein